MEGLDDTSPGLCGKTNHSPHDQEIRAYVDKPESPNHLTTYVTSDLEVSYRAHSVGPASPGMGL